jgi:hypothetical protein
MLRKSSAANLVVSSILPVRKPFPSGLNATNPINRSLLPQLFLYFPSRARSTPPLRAFVDAAKELATDAV